MTDRELLELAAKAAGYDFKWETSFGSLTEEDEPTIFDEEGFGQFWSPLTDDGDALRLAVKLRIVVDYYERHSSTECACAAWSIAASGGAEHEEIGADPCAAARRAIVRAAAEIGKAMP